MLRKEMEMLWNKVCVCASKDLLEKEKIPFFLVHILTFSCLCFHTCLIPIHSLIFIFKTIISCRSSYENRLQLFLIMAQAASCHLSSLLSEKCPPLTLASTYQDLSLLKTFAFALSLGCNAVFLQLTHSHPPGLCLNLTSSGKPSLFTPSEKGHHPTPYFPLYNSVHVFHSTFYKSIIIFLCYYYFICLSPCPALKYMLLHYLDCFVHLGIPSIVAQCLAHSR